VFINNALLLPSRVHALALLDGFPDVTTFADHFVTASDRLFSGHLIHWDPADAVKCAKGHRCIGMSCQRRLQWDSARGAFFCPAYPGVDIQLKPSQTK
jgi:hypothetical protein